MEYILIIFIVSVVTSLFIYSDKKYKETAYYKVTQNAYSRIKYDKGKYGEYLIYKRLRHYERDGAKFLFNIYIPKSNNETSEIDVLLISSKGLFVFESKNFSGWIFGNEAHKNWTQTFPRGKGSSHKKAFYNPIMQNFSHIKHLKRIVGEDVSMRSIIVFSDMCTLKNVKTQSKDVWVTYCNHVASSIAHICLQTKTDLLTQTEIEDIYNKLYPFTQVGLEIRNQHINNLQKTTL